MVARLELEIFQGNEDNLGSFADIYLASFNNPISQEVCFDPTLHTAEERRQYCLESRVFLLNYFVS